MKILPFEANFGGKFNTPLSVICTTPELSNLSYEKTINCYLDADTVTPEGVFSNDK